MNYIKASFSDRFVAASIDSLILFLPLIGIVLVTGIDSAEVWSFVLGLGYNVFFLVKTGATIGKKLMRIRVVGSEYQKVSFGKALLRESVGKWISSIGYLGYLWMPFDRRRQTWHDKIAKTLVIKLGKDGQPIVGEDPKPKSKWWFIALILLPIVVLLTFLCAYLFVAEPVRVAGSGMAPNYPDGQYYLVDKIGYRLSDPERGEVIIFQHPSQSDTIYVKRIVGLPGESVKIQDGQVFIDGQVLEEPYLPIDSRTVAREFMQEGVETKVEDGTLFVLGDNRMGSSDSREWGFVPIENVTGKLWWRYH